MNLPPPLPADANQPATKDDIEAAMKAIARESWNLALEAAANAVKGDGSKAAIRALRMK